MRIIASSAQKILSARMPAGLWKLLALVSLIVTPFGMIGATAAPAGHHAGATSAPCGEHPAQPDEQTCQLDCTATCSMLIAEQAPLAGQKALPRVPRQADGDPFARGIDREAETPPPKRG